MPVIKKFRSLEDVAGSGVTIAVQNRQLTFSPLALRDYADAKMRMKSANLNAYMQAVRRAPEDGKPTPLEQDAMTLRILREDIDDIRVAGWLSTLEGEVFLVHRSLSKLQPDVTEEDVESMFADAGLLAQITRAIDALDADEQTKEEAAKASENPPQNSSQNGKAQSQDSAPPTE